MEFAFKLTALGNDNRAANPGKLGVFVDEQQQQLQQSPIGSWRRKQEPLRGQMESESECQCQI